MVRHPDIVSGGVLAVLAVVLWVVSQGIEVNLGQTTFTARFFPQLMALILGGCGIGIAAKGLFAARQSLPEVFSWRVCGLGVLLLVYFLGFEHIDFRVGSWAVMLSCMYLLGARRPLELVIIPICLSVAVYAVFRYAFVIILPTWN